MPATLSPLTKAQDQIIETIELVQDRVIDTNQKVAASLNERVPAAITTRLNGLPRLELPAPAEAVDNYFRFVQRVTTANHKFATEIVKVWTPTQAASPEPGEPVAQPAAESPEAKSTAKSSAAKATAQKAPAKKAPAKKAPAKKLAAEKPATQSTK